VRRDWCGVTWCVGIPQSGKTTHALRLVTEASTRLRIPFLALDSAHVAQLGGIPRARSFDDVLRRLWIDRSSCAWSPNHLDDVDRTCKAIRAGRRVLLLVDEAHFWLSSRSGVSASLVALMRATQHAESHVYLTTHHLTGDIPQSALSCAPTLYVFRCTSPRVLQVLEQEFALDSALIRTLPQFAFIEHRTGF
jgi:hypothetical protein